MPTNTPLVSIIIPTFNRAHLIGETLDSILAQTYKNWECIVIDDGSIDNTDEILKAYVNRDTRFQYYHRPSTKTKGANACRNHGLAKAKGDYIIFFDSDDLMTTEHLETKISNILKFDCDFIITRTKYFNKKNTEIKIYNGLNIQTITPHNYVIQKVNWLTPDTCIKSKIAKLISFNENLQSGQEYNYYTKLVYLSRKAIFINKVITLRRHHEESIRTTLNSGIKKPKQSFLASWYTYQDIKSFAEKRTRLFLINKCSRIYMDQRQTFAISRKTYYLTLLKEKGFRVIYLILFRFSINLFNKGNIFRRLFFKK